MILTGLEGRLVYKKSRRLEKYLLECLVLDFVYYVNFMNISFNFNKKEKLIDVVRVVSNIQNLWI